MVTANSKLFRQKALDRTASPEQLVATIASQVVFSSQSHLTLHCKNLTGMTPRQISNHRKILINSHKNL
jgi:AraC-like DNA-binding protein